MKAKALLSLVLGFFLSLAWSFVEASPDLTVGQEQGEAGQTILAPIDFLSDDTSVHLQFDLFYDPSTFTAGIPSSGIAVADHVVDSNEIAAGQLRFVVYSVSNAQLGSGNLINLPVTISEGALPGIYPLDISAVVISDADGLPVTPTLVGNGSIEVLEDESLVPVPVNGPLGLILLAGLLLWLSVRAIKNPHASTTRVLLVFVLFNFSMWSLGIFPALAALPGDADDDGDIDANDLLLTVDVILERAAAPGDPDCNTDGYINVLDLPCQITFTDNAAPDLVPPGDRELMVASEFSSTLMAIDPDPSDELTFSLPVAPPGMTCDPATGQLLWTPLEGDIGDHTVTARVTDREGLSDSETFVVHVYLPISVENRNAAPDLLPLPDQDLMTGGNLEILAVATDPDPGDVLTYSLPRAPDGMVIDALSGQVQWMPGVDQSGQHDVTVMVTDDGGLSDAEAFLVSVTSPNEAPTAADDYYIARMGETLMVDSPGVLDNDTDPDGDLLQASLVQDANNGTLNLSPDGSFDYTPTAPQVIGNIQEVNQTMWLRPYNRASDRMPPYEYSFGADGDLNTSWIADADIDSFTYYLRFDGELRPTVKELRLYGNRGDIADGHDIYSGRFILEDINGDLLYESEELDLAPPDRDIVFPIPGGPISDVYRVEFVFSEFENKGNTEEPLPQPGFAELEVISDQEVLDVEKEWEYTSSIIAPEYIKVVSTPLVGDINLDQIPDILFVTYRTSSNGILRAVSGNDGSEIFVADDLAGSALTNDELHYSASLAMGDIDLDGYPEILGIYGDYIKAFQYDIAAGEIVREWISEQIPNPRDGGMSIADIDADGIPEIIVGSRLELTVLNNDGSIRWQIPLYNNGGYRYKFPFAVDLDLDGTMEILSGQMAYTASGGMHWSPPDSSLGDGLNAVGNFDNDPYPEVVLVSSSAGWTGVNLLEHDGTKIWGPAHTDGAISPPTVADFDGDGFPEIGVSGKKRYTVIDTDGTVLWKRKIQDITSEHTGSTVFDFDGDGSAEVVFSDELDLIIFRGSDGAILFRTPIGSGTRWEYPVIADVDADGHAEIVAVRNQYGEEVHEKDGIHVFGGPGNDWVPTRKIWNQHAYHVTNINDDLSIPAIQQYNWLISGLNNFRMNAPYLDEDGSADQFTYKADDGVLESNEATVFIDIQPANAIPVIVSTPKTDATAGFVYAYWVVARDQDNDPLIFSLTNGPAGMTIDPLTGKITWVPADIDLGEQPVMVSVADNKGGVAIQNYTLTVVEPVTVPYVIGETQANAETLIGAEGLDIGAVTEAYNISVAAGLVAHQSPPAGSVAEPGSDVDFVLSLGPAPEDIDDDGDGFTENEGDCDDTDSAVHPGAADQAGDGIDQDCDGIDGNLVIAEIFVDPLTSTVLTGQQVQHSATAVFEDETSQNISGLVAWSSSAPAIAGVDADGVVTALAAGASSIQASFDGNTGSASLTVHAFVPGDSVPPLAEITDPVTDTVITAPTEIIGTASDDNFLKYELAVAPAGEEEFTVIHTSTSPVTGGLLGTLDSTMLLNDLYTLRLTVYDTGGNIMEDEIIVQVEGFMKVGNFMLTYTDIALPMSGVPIRVMRTYDSRDKRKRDFGFNWSLDIETMRVRSSLKLGTAWRVEKSGLSYQLLPSDTHKVTITLPGGRVEEFDMFISPNPSVIVPFSSVTASFEPSFGTYGKLESLDDNALLVVGNQPGDVTLIDFGGNTFNPQNFRYTTVEGTQYVINKTDGLQNVTERGGSTLTFTPVGITHSNGKTIAFQRDSENRITSITDPNGNEQEYTYNGNGDLASHTDALGNITRFFYNRTHGLLRLEDPLGNRAIRNEFDDDGRLVAQIDADGNRVEFSRDILGRQEVMTDVHGNTHVLEYDERGNAISRQRQVTIDGTPTLVIETFEYDAEGNQTLSVNPDGHRVEYQYDARGNITGVISDPGGLNISSIAEYDDRNNILKQIDPLGNEILYSHDGSSNIVQIDEPMGITSQYTYDSAGRIIEITDTLGNRRHTTYTASGLIAKLEDFDADGVLASKKSYVYDNNGNLETATIYRDVDGILTPFVTTHSYDANNRRVRTLDPFGNEFTMEYDAVGNIEATTDLDGNRTEYEYDARFMLHRVRFPDGTTIEKEYDAAGNLIEQVGRGGERTRFEYDELNRQIKTILPDGSSVQNILSPGGRLLASEDGKGERVEFEYDSSGRRIKTTSPEVKDSNSGLMVRLEVTEEYDAGNRLTASVDHQGNRTELEYDDNSRVTQTIYPDGSSRHYEYDALHRMTSITDEEGRVTSYEYDGGRRLLSVTLPAPAPGEPAPVTSYTYDISGNRLTQTDAIGRTTAFAYDDHGRLIRRSLPEGQFETIDYNPNGTPRSVQDFNGNTVGFEYDVSGRVTRKTYSDGSVETASYTSDGQPEILTGPHGTTSYAYDANGRLSSVIQSDGQTLDYSYDANGNIEAITVNSLRTISYKYDALNRLSQVTAPEGLTNYEYDTVGALAKLSNPNGVTTRITRDVRRRLTDLVFEEPGGEILEHFEYGYTPSGHRESEIEIDGSVVNYFYDDLGRLVEESRTGTDPRNITYEYDLVGNRTRMTRSGDVTEYSYNANDNLIAQTGISYTYDPSGNRLSKTVDGNLMVYGWDVKGKLAEVRKPAGITSFAYDTEGRRIGKTTGPEALHHLNDRLNMTGNHQVLEERDETGATLAQYSYGRDLISQTQAGENHYHQTDALGSTRLLTDDAGQKSDGFGFDAYGNAVSRTGDTPNQYLFAGEQWDEEAEAYYLRARYYDPSAGVFLSKDPYWGNIRKPGTLHGYQYTGNNPVNFVDPTGLFGAPTSLMELQVVQAIRTGMRAVWNAYKGMKMCQGVGVLRQAETITHLSRLFFSMAPNLTEAANGNWRSLIDKRLVDIKVDPYSPPIRIFGRDYNSLTFKVNYTGKTAEDGNQDSLKMNFELAEKGGQKIALDVERNGNEVLVNGQGVVEFYKKNITSLRRCGIEVAKLNWEVTGVLGASLSTNAKNTKAYSGVETGLELESSIVPWAKSFPVLSFMVESGGFDFKLFGQGMDDWASFFPPKTSGGTSYCPGSGMQN